MRRYILLLTITCAVFFAAKAQNADTLTRKSKTDSIYRKKDEKTSKRFVPKLGKEGVYHPDSLHSPHTAWTRSAFVPGLGQIYNHQWWKVPAIYVGLGLLTNAIIYNQGQYKDFLAVARFQQTGKSVDDPSFANDPNLPLYREYGIYSSAAIIDAKDGYYRNKEISILGFLAVWAVNVADAYIYGKLQNAFSMDNNFSLQVTPTNINQAVYASNFNTTFTPGIKLTLTLK